MIGGPDTPAIGWAAGVERIILASGLHPTPQPSCDLLVVAVEGEQVATAQSLAVSARTAGRAARLEVAGRSVKASLKHADRIGASFVALVGADGVALKDMDTGQQSQFSTIEEALVAIQEDQQ